jgi:hypothetical protein
MKKVIIVFLALSVLAFLPVQKATALEIPDFNPCDIVPQLCQITPTLEPTVTEDPTITPSITVDPTDEAVTPTATPTAPPSNTGGDGRSDGKSSCPDCTKAPVVPKGAPATGRG